MTTTEYHAQSIIDNMSEIEQLVLRLPNTDEGANAAKRAHGLILDAMHGLQSELEDIEKPTTE